MTQAKGSIEGEASSIELTGFVRERLEGALMRLLTNGGRPYSSSLTAKSRLPYPLSSSAPSGGDADSGGHWCGKRSRAPAVSVLTS